ncbi:acetylxylan esterase [Actinospica durhamensis]|uniref:Acetylxylan esterase n=1 Tax=Actinospica durhamensis TaxID=1508375 RepID=A0A941ESH6_9ACTN|nr:acetylxylan esterase [Actinospica durhamensis]MBR7837242.1 acetylxylan esterase [Actinospica durhamensis]
MYFDLPEAELAGYHSTQTEPDDFCGFWDQTLAQARSHDLNLRLTRSDSVVTQLDLFDVSFRGYDGQEVRAWLRSPRGALEGLPVVVEFVGYGGGRGRVESSLFWAACGYAHLVMDTRGQGSSWRCGDTGDDAWTGPQTPGMMTKGIGHRDTYYYRRLFVDAARALDAARAILSPSHIIASGISQGGGTAVAAAMLAGPVDAVVANVPFLCDFPRAITVTDSDPYAEIRRYLAIHRDAQDQVYNTLRYFDVVNFARRCTFPALYSTALMDMVAPPSTVYAAYNAYAGQKEIVLHRFNGHDHDTDDDVRVARRLQAMGLGPH